MVLVQSSLSVIAMAITAPDVTRISGPAIENFGTSGLSKASVALRTIWPRRWSILPAEGDREPARAPAAGSRMACCACSAPCTSRRLPEPPFRRAVPAKPADRAVRVPIASPLIQPSPNGRRVGIRIVTFEACSGFTHVTARRMLNRLKRPLSRGSSPAGYPAEPLVSYQINRHLFG